MDRHRITRYVEPLREGGSLPGLVEADDDGLYVVKLRGAGQGVPALNSEIVVGELARTIGLRVPEIVMLELDEASAERRELRQRAAGNHLLERQKLVGAIGLVEDFDRGIEANTLLPAHERFIAEYRSGSGFDDRLEGVFYDELSKRHDLIAGIATNDAGRDGGSQRHAILHCEVFYFAAKMEEKGQRTLSPM